jgi:hypothetical protein
LVVKLEELGYIPAPGGGFEAVLSLERDENLRLMPGMTCKVTLDNSESEKEEKPAAAGSPKQSAARQ